MDSFCVLPVEPADLRPIAHAEFCRKVNHSIEFARFSIPSVCVTQFLDIAPRPVANSGSRPAHNHGSLVKESRKSFVSLRISNQP